MTVPVQTPVSNHVGNGVTTSFPYAFRLLDAADIVVSVDGQEKALNIDYTVVGLGIEVGGTIVFSVAPPALSAVALVRQVPINRLTDYQYSGDFQSPTVNNDFDRIVMMLQDSGLALANTIRLPPGDAASGVLPDAAGRALKGLAFDAEGDIFLTAASGNADVLAAALGSSATAALGGGLVGYDGTKNYAAGTIGKGIKDAAATGAQGIADAATAAAAAASANTNTNNYKADVASVADVAKGAALMGYKLNATGSVGRTLAAKLLEQVSVKDFGAVGDGATDDAAAITAAIAFMGTLGGGRVFFPPGTYRVASTISVQTNNIMLEGSGYSSTIVKADLAVSPVIKFGNAAAVNSVVNCQHRDMTVTRAAGAIPVGTIGVLWSLFNYGTESGVLVDRNQINRQITGNSGGISIQWSSYEPYSSNAVQFHYVIEHAAGIKVFGGEIGRNGGETFDSNAVINITGQANDITFSGASFLPRGPSVVKPSVVSFTNYLNTTGVIKFIDILTENTSVCFVSDAASTLINDLSIVGGRWASVTSFWNLNAATKVRSCRIVGATMAPQWIIVNPEWLSMSGCTIGGAVTINGGSGSVAAIGANVFLGAVTVGAAWGKLCFVGNIIQGTFTDSATGGKVIANNA